MDTKPLYFVFGDDSEQREPRLKNAGSLVAFGGFVIGAEQLWSFNRKIGRLAKKFGFPKHAEIKWSPKKRNDWMWNGLSRDSKSKLYQSIIECLSDFRARVIVCIVDSNYAPANTRCSPEEDVAILFLERVQKLCERESAHYVIVADEPGGDKRDQSSYLSEKLSRIQKGTNYVELDRDIAHPFLICSSNTSRALQTADVVVGSVLARFALDQELAKELFPKLSALFYTSHKQGEYCGYGLKVHPSNYDPICSAITENNELSKSMLRRLYSDNES